MSLKTVHLDYCITLERIELWPPNTDMKKYDRYELSMHWNHIQGDRNNNSGSTPIKGKVDYKGIGKGVGDANIIFNGDNKPFELHVTLSRKMPVNSGESEPFKDNFIKFELRENRETLATATIDFRKPENIVLDGKKISEDMTGNFKPMSPPKLCVKIERINKNIEDPANKFWSKIASNFHWQQKWEQVYTENVDVDKGGIKIEWFKGGLTNICHNCLDENIKSGNGDKKALLWEGNKPGVNGSLTYEKLLVRVCQLANFLKEKGVKKCDTVIIYLPMIMELPITMLACARIGAVHSVVVAGYSKELLFKIIKDCKPKIVVTSVAFKDNVDYALSEASNKRIISEVKCFIYAMKKEEAKRQEGRDIWLKEEVLTKCLPTCPVEWVDADEHPLFILYTSGSSTGEPKGVLHTTGGYMVYTAETFKYAFDYKDSDDVYWCTADCGWITGHSYVVYGPLLNGAKVVLYEGIHYPDARRFCEIVKKHKVTLLYTAPKLLLSLKNARDDKNVTRSCQTLRVLGIVGEPLKESARSWFSKVVEDRCPISDIWWQTETGGFMITHKPAVKSGSDNATFPFFGVKPVIVDEKGVEIDGERSGYLRIKSSWPGAFRTLYGDKPGYETTYFKPFPGYYFRRDDDGYCRLLESVDDVRVDDVIARLKNLQLVGEASTSAGPSGGN